MKISYLFTIVLALVLSACAVNPATGGRALGFMGEEAEFQKGAEAIGDIIKQEGGLYEEKPVLEAYLKERLAAVVAVSERPDKPFELTFLDNQVINAYALPGYVMITRGILPYFNNEAELMTVLGHEVGHITARHMVRSQAAETLGNLGLGIALIAVSTQIDSSAEMELLAQTAAIGAAVGMQTYGRKHESEADKLGMRYLAKLGYDVTQAANTFDMFYYYNDYFNKLMNLADEDVPDSLLGHLLASHPDPDHRAAVLRELAAENTSGGAKIGKIDYLQKIDGLAFGQMPDKGGTYGKQRYYDSTYRLTYDLPPYWFFTHMAPRLPEAIHPASGAKFNVFQVSAKADESAKELLLYKAKGVTNLTRVEHPDYDIVMGELRTTAGLFNSNSEDKFAKVAIVKSLKPVSDKAKSKALLFEIDLKDPALLGTAGADLLPILQSLKHLSKEQAEALQPLRIKLRAVKKGETVASLSKELPFNVLHEEQFRLLNGMFNGAEVREGQLIKMIVDPN